MLKSRNKKSKSAHKPIAIDIVIVLILLVLVGGFWFIENSGEKLKVNGHVYSLTVAKNSTEQSRGLKKLSSLPTDQGVLFVYHDEARRCFLISGLHITFDMVWTDASKKVIAIAHNVMPQAYPKICSAKAAEYVIGLTAGQADSANIQANQVLSF